VSSALLITDREPHECPVRPERSSGRASFRLLLQDARTRQREARATTKAGLRPRHEPPKGGCFTPEGSSERPRPRGHEPKLRAYELRRRRVGCQSVSRPFRSSSVRWADYLDRDRCNSPWEARRSVVSTGRCVWARMYAAHTPHCTRPPRSQRKGDLNATQARDASHSRNRNAGRGRAGARSRRGRVRWAQWNGCATGCGLYWRLESLCEFPVWQLPIWDRERDHCVPHLPVGALRF
jgi:hypothetical protein